MSNVEETRGRKIELAWQNHEYSYDVALNPRERARVKSLWTFLLPYSDVAIELFLSRLIHEDPELEAIFLPCRDPVKERFLWLFDSAVRTLTPHTECPLREGYVAPPGLDPAARPTQAALYEGFMALSMSPRRWQLACQVFLATVAATPGPTQDHKDLALMGTGGVLGRFFMQCVVTPMSGAHEPTAFLDDLWHRGGRRTAFSSSRALQRIRHDGRVDLEGKARDFLRLCAEELGWGDARLRRRMAQTRSALDQGLPPEHSVDEFAHGARVAWRNASKCIGRISWRTLQVRDRRDVKDPADVFDACVDHMRASVKGGVITSILTAFRARRANELWGPRIWNSQLIRYAAYREPDGTILGDKANLALTDALMGEGWTPPAAKSAFDPLPIAIEMPGCPPALFELDRADIPEVAIEHPTEPRLAALGLKWCAVPVLTNFRLEIGGVDYTCAPFNGWFMETEIARNLFEQNRYDRAHDIAHAFGLDTTSEATLWRDRAFLELCVAIIHSFDNAGVTLVDHQTAARQFLRHEERELKAGRECPAQWSWITPAAGGSTVPTWHREMRDFHLSPHFAYAADMWAMLSMALPQITVQHRDDNTVRPLILFASETGTAEGAAHQLELRLRAIRPLVLSMDDVSLPDLAVARVVLIVCSTFGDGDVPTSGRMLAEALRCAPAGTLTETRFAVVGLGNSTYRHFCAPAQRFHKALRRVGAKPLAAGLALADERSGQASTIRTWIEAVAREVLGACESAVVRPAPSAFPAMLPALKHVHRGSFATAVVTTNEELYGDAGSTRSARHIELDLADEGLRYTTGDYLLVRPQNRTSDVNALLERLDSRTDGRLNGHDHGPHAPSRDGLDSRTTLLEKVDLSLPQDPYDLIATIAASAGRPDRQQLDDWLAVLQPDADREGKGALTRWLRANVPDVVRLLRSFPTVRPTIGELLDVLAPLKPRYYSIASCATCHPRKARIIVSGQRHTLAHGVIGDGFCSGWLSTLPPGARVRVAIRSPARRIVPANDGPLILVGAGSGLAGPLAVVEGRERRGVQPGPIHLYFGCRNEAEFIFRRTLEDWRAAGHLDGLRVAFSRSRNAAYVQNLIRLDAMMLRPLVRHPRAQVLVCGDVAMAREVRDALALAASDPGTMNGRNILDAMTEAGRYVEDVWSASQ